MIVRWGIDSLSAVLAELSVQRPLLVTSERWADLELPLERRFSGVRPHAEVEGVQAAVAAAAGADAVVALGGGSAIDTAKAVSQRLGLPQISIPTTYSGAEWTEFFGVRDRATRSKAGGGGAHVVAIVYEPELTLDLPPASTGGTALNALAHCAEALYAPGRSEETDSEALSGAALISASLPAVLEQPHDREARRALLEGAMHAGAALRAGMGVGHAMAQALGGRYGLAHGAMNGVCLGPALSFNAEVAADAIARFGEAMDAGEPVARVQALAGLANPTRLRDYDVPREDLAELAEQAAARPAARSNPRPAPPDAILELLSGAW
ncbi:MAG: iron-containing alcohol dehydrogenase [Solirubrobacteraceae bacterium]